MTYFVPVLIYCMTHLGLCTASVPPLHFPSLVACHSFLDNPVVQTNGYDSEHSFCREFTE